MIPKFGPIELLIILGFIAIVIAIIIGARKTIGGGPSNSSPTLPLGDNTQYSPTTNLPTNVQTSNAFARLLSPAGIVIIVCFFLPWITVSCGAQPVINQATGFEIANPMNIAGEETEGARDLYLVLAGGVILAFLGTALWTRPNGVASVLCLISSLLIGWTIFAFWQRAVSALEQDQFAASFIIIRWEIGYWGTVIATITGTIASLLSFVRRL